MEAFPLPNQEGTTVARKLVDEIFLRFLTPEQLHSDQGRQFEGQLITEVCKLLNINKTRTTPYHPQCDGLVERFNRTLLNMLATCSKDHPFDWEDYIRMVCVTYNSSIQSSTGYTPYVWQAGKVPINVLYGTREGPYQSQAEYAKLLKTRLSSAFNIVGSMSLRNTDGRRSFMMQKCMVHPIKLEIMFGYTHHLQKEHPISCTTLGPDLTKSLRKFLMKHTGFSISMATVNVKLYTLIG